MTKKDYEPIHETLRTGFTERYLERSGLGKFAFSVAYDPNNPLCDYDKTWWEAQPSGLSIPIGKIVLGKMMHKIPYGDVEKVVAQPFAERADEITAALQEYPVTLINGHNPDLQAALSLFGAGIGIASATSGGSFQKRYEDIVRISHGVVTRGIAPITVGKKGFPLNIDFMRLQQLLVSPHLSFPLNAQMRESGISEEFIKEYNARFKENAIAVAQDETSHPNDYRTLWSLAPGGTKDEAGVGEQEGKLLTAEITPGTVTFMGAMGCAFLPVYTSFGRGKRPSVIELGNIIPPNEITGTTLHGIMGDLADFRRQHGEPNVYYAGEV